jgi:hypothetical protein
VVLPAAWDMKPIGQRAENHTCERCDKPRRTRALREHDPAGRLLCATCSKEVAQMVAALEEILDAHRALRTFLSYDDKEANDFMTDARIALDEAEARIKRLIEKPETKS